MTHPSARAILSDAMTSHALVALRSARHARMRGSLIAAIGALGLAGCGGTVTLDDGAGGSGTSGSSSGSWGSTGTSGTTTVSTGTGTTDKCVDPKPVLLPSGQPSGYVECADGAINRVEARSCDPGTVTGEACSNPGEFAACQSDADCNEKPGGRCLTQWGEFGGDGSGCGCAYPCTSDSDCDPSQVCACAGVLPTLVDNTCVSYGCKSNDDCAEGECGIGSYDDGCGRQTYLGCRSDFDACRSNADCSANGGECSMSYPASTFDCQTPNCAIGRPMMVEGQARAARSEARADWSMELAVDTSRYAPELRAALATRFGAIAALEHASVGSFARFTLQLLALGAPSELVAEAQRAALDEVEHARIAYALATRFGGVEVGPSALPEATAAIAVDARSIVRSLVEEACVGETLGVAEALAVADAVEDPALAALFRRIAEDEQRHAELAWRTLSWLLTRDASLASAAREGAERARALLEAKDEGLVAREAGLLSGAELASIRTQAYEEVVRPCLATLGCA